MIVRESVPNDFFCIDWQPAQEVEAFSVMNVAEEVLSKTHALTVLNDNGACMAMAGLFEVGKDTAFVWVFLSRWAGRYMFGLTKLLKEAMIANACNYKFIETSVRSDFKPGHRWAKLCGFELVEEKYNNDPEGNAMDLYRRAV